MKRVRTVLGWTAVVLVSLVACLWALWGGIENFHEGWYERDVGRNLLMMFVQYWLLTLVFVTVGLTGVAFPRVTAVLCAALGVGAAFFFAGAQVTTLRFLIVLPFAVVGLLFFLGRPVPKGLARLLVTAPPLLVLLATSIFGIARVTTRVDDGETGLRIVSGNGVRLVWAPRGPGWPEEAVTWEDASRVCRHLSEDGSTLRDEVVGVWRLPTVEEAVRSQARHGVNAGGVWDAETRRATYRLTPDKETPLWDPHSPIIYYWTSTRVDDRTALMIVYHGGVFPRQSALPYDSLSFRAVKDAPP